ncbi:helix-turn-helix transcriptional regulator [Pollutibacter soli]|uniref:helix-turn-helix domain-containing protein n=1 Tax=Pollutibacter soli TaxID=3034157 RepID=UPI003013AB15
MSVQAAIFIFALGGMQGLLFVLFLLQRKLYRSGYIFLLLYLASLLLVMTLKLMNKLWLMDNLSAYYSMTHFVPLFLGPLIYLFVKSMIRNEKFEPVQLLHFLPVIIIAVLFSTGLTNTNSLAAKLFDPGLRLFLLLLSISVYHYLAIEIFRNRFQYNDDSIARNTFLLNWFKPFIWMSFVVSFLIVIALYLLFVNYPYGYKYRYGFVAITIFMYWISYSALKQPAIFSVIRGGALPPESATPVLRVHRPIKKYASSNLSPDEKERICQSLEALMTQTKLYLHADVTIDQLADKLSCSRHVLSQVLNECVQQTFYNYINSFRIEHAKQMLNNARYNDNKIASIAYDSGFNSLSAFNEVFKKMTGTTPSKFRTEKLPSSQRQRI